MINTVKSLARENIESGKGEIPKELYQEMLDWPILIESENNFNTAAGLASSSSGLSCLGYALANLYGLENIDVSILARIGSGSACRSVYGGFVKWDKGWQEKSELDYPQEVSKNSVAKKVEVANLQYWLDNLRILVCVVKPE